MAFPTIPTTGAGRVLSTLTTAASTTHTFPSLSSLTKNSGDLLIAICIEYQGTVSNTNFSSWGGGFTEFNDIGAADSITIGCAYKWSTGSETGTFTVISTSSQQSVQFLLAIPGAHASTIPEAGGDQVAVAGTADPNSFDPAGWGAEDTLWIAVAGCGETSTGGAFTGLAATDPTNYSNIVASSITADAVGGLNAAVAFRQLNAASEDPAAFTNDTSSSRVRSLVIAVRPAADPNATVTPARINSVATVQAPTIDDGTGASFPQWQASGYGSTTWAATTGTTKNLLIPSGATVGHLGVIVVGVNGAASNDITISGWTRKYITTLTGWGDTFAMMAVFYKEIQSGDPGSNAVISIPQQPRGGASIHTFLNGLVGADPFEDPDFDESASSAQPVSLSATATDKSAAITAITNDSTSITATEPSGFTRRHTTPGGTDPGHVAVKESVDTTTENAQWVLSATNRNNPWMAIIKGASGGGGSPDATVTPARINAVANVRAVTIPGLLPGSIAGIEPESHAYTVPIMDSNGNLYRISESFLAENNQPKANKSTDGGATWVEQDAANRPGTDTSSIGDLESGWTIWDSTDKTLRFAWQRSFVAYSAFRTSDHATNPDTWVANTRENVAAITGSPQYASITKPTDQSYEWLFYNNSTTKPSYKQRNSAGSYGSQLDVDTAGQHPAAILAPNGTDSYIVYRKTNDLVYKKLTSGGTLDSSATRIDTNGLISTTPIAFAAPQMHTQAGNVYMGVLFCNSSTAPRFVLVTNGTPGSEETVDADGVLQNPGDTTNDASVMSLAVDPDNGTFYAVWVDTTTGDVRMRERPHGGSWSSETTLYTATGAEEVQWVYATVLDRGATKALAYTYDVGPHLDDEGDIQYNEMALASSQDATATPARINATTTVQAPTVQISHTVSPARVLAAASVLAVSLAAPATVTPARINVPATIQSVSLSAPTTVTPARINGVTTVQLPALSGHATVTPARINGVTTVQSPTLSGPTTVTPARINGVTTVQSPTLKSDTTVTPARISTAATVFASSVAIVDNATVTPARISTAATVFAPAVSAASNATVTPARISTAATVFAPAVSAASNATVTPARIDGIATVFAPAVSASGTATPQPARISTAVTVFAPTVQTSQTVTPSRIDGVAQVFNPTIRVGAGPAPSRISATTATIFAPTVQAQGNATPTPARINGVTTVQSPTVTAQDNETVTPARINAIASIFSPTIRTSATPTPSRIQTTTTIPLPVITTGIAEAPFTPDAAAVLEGNTAGQIFSDNTSGVVLDDNASAVTLTDNPAGVTVSDNPAGEELDTNPAGVVLDENPTSATWDAT